MNIIGQKAAGYEQRERELSVFTSGGNEVIIGFISESTVQTRVRFSKDEEFDKSYAIEEMPLRNAAVTFEETADVYQISSPKISVKIYKEDMRIEYLKNGNIITSVKAMGRDRDGVYCVHPMGEREHFYGLGEDNRAYLGNMDRRGTKRELITGQQINVGHVTADIPVSFFMSTGETSPYGIFADSSYRMVFDMGSTSPDEYSRKADGGSLVYYLFEGDDLGGVLNEYTGLTGKRSMPPQWALGYIQCKCSYWCWEE
ncbi:MAG: DUF4968 domain-containing protein, partial [Ruminococcus sp.]|nr:DUF4968 domain-containing protein [Ruminococcus sp.]